MSGPKIDQVELERRKREEIERARLERLRRIREQTDLFCAEKNVFVENCAEICAFLLYLSHKP